VLGARFGTGMTGGGGAPATAAMAWRGAGWCEGGEKFVGLYIAQLVVTAG
jgi:hypothetical protein